MELKDQLKLIIKLQKLDSEIFVLQKKKSDLPALIKNLEDEFKKEGESIKQNESEFKQLQVKHKQKENELLTKEETIKKYQVQLLQLKTNKEYTTMQQEINGVKADKSVLEDEIIMLLDEIEENNKKINQLKTHLKEKENKLNLDKKKVDDELKEIESKLSKLQSERTQLVGNIDKNALSKYERILNGKDGLAMVPVVDKACGGCHLNLPPQVINEIKMTKELIFCESCARILYIEEDNE